MNIFIFLLKIKYFLKNYKRTKIFYILNYRCKKITIFKRKKYSKKD
jgi:hypothetical protein